MPRTSERTDACHGPDGHGDEPRQVHRLPHLLGDVQAGVDQPRRHRVRLVQQRRDPPRAGVSAPLRGPGDVARRLDAEPARPAAAQGRRPGQEAASGSSPARCSPSSRTTTSPGPTTTRPWSTRPLGDDFPVARPKSLITGEDTKITLVGELGRQPRRRRRDGPPRPDRGEGPAGSPRTGSSSSSSRPSCSTCRGSASTASTRRAWPPAPPERSTSGPRTASCWSTRTDAAAGGSASPAARTRRSTSTTRPARPRSAPSATRGSRSGCRRSARRPAWAGCATSALFLYDADRVTAAASVTDDEGPLPTPSWTCCSTRTTPPSSPTARAQGIPDDWMDAARRSPVYALAKIYQVALPLHPEYRTMPMVWYVPPLSPVVDLLRDQGHDARGPRQPVRRHRGAADPGGVPRGAVHRRRHRHGHRRCCGGSPPCGPSCAASPSATTPTTSIPDVGGDDRRRACTRCTG